MVSSRYPLVSMSNFLSLRKGFFQIEDSEEYRLVTVQLHARGIRERSRLLGSKIKTKRQQKVKANDLLVAEIDAKVGGYGIVPPDLDGSIVSSHYYLYEIDNCQVDSTYLEYYLKSGIPEQDVGQFVKGSVNYAAIRPYHYPQLTIPLPPLDEQKRIVKRIRDIEQKLEEIIHLQEETEQAMFGILLGAYRRIAASAPTQPMAEVAPLVRRTVKIAPDEEYPELGLRSWGKGTFHKPAIKGSDLNGKRLYRIEAGDLVFSNVFSWEGAVAVARREDHGRFGSHRFISRVARLGIASPQFLYFHFMTEEGLQQLRDASPGSAGRNRTLGLKALDAIQVPVPNFEEQCWFDKVFQRTESLREEQAEVLKEVDALLPAVLERAFRGEL